MLNKYSECPGYMAEECCPLKTVGDTVYVLDPEFMEEQGPLATASFACLSGCVYQEQDNPGNRYCWAKGEL